MKRMMNTISDATDADHNRLHPHGYGEQRIVLEGVSWTTFRQLSEEKQGSGIRLTYECGRLEIMAPSRMHEKFKRLMGRMIETAAEELDLPLDSGSSMTFRQAETARGLEADECYWIQNAAAVTGKDTIDFATDPPPDLAIEVDLTSSSLDKFGIYASLGVPEVWRYDGQSLRVVTLLPSGDSYEETGRSLAFPGLSLEWIASFLARWNEMDETAWIKEFRQWVREHVTPCT